jgi:riboflavin biosynthesis pyrimidine reductase
VRCLLPRAADDVDLEAAYAPPGHRPFVRCNMITSLDGAISVDGRSGALGGPADHRVFATLRAWADVVVVGAGTARAETYGPARLDAAAQATRAARGQAPQPPIAVVSNRGEFDPSTPFFADAQSRPILVVPATAAERARAAGERADVLAAGDDAVDLAAALRALHERGLSSVLVEGGPTLNGELARAGLLDELCLTVSPRIVGGDGPRVLAGPTFLPPIATSAHHVLEEDGFLFLRLALRG